MPYVTRNITVNEQLMNATTSSLIAHAIIQMAHDLDLKVIAEGVVTKKEVELLRQHNGDGIQGYLFSRPLLDREFNQILVNSKRLQI